MLCQTSESVLVDMPDISRSIPLRLRIAFAAAGLAGACLATTGALAAPGASSSPHRMPASAARVGAGLAARQDALARASASVVGIEVVAVDDAGSIESLGRVRSGSGVVIDRDGLVLTIGYLVLEADHIDLLLDGDRRVPARVVAYDVASGFGLLQALSPLHLQPAPLGRSDRIGDDEPLMVVSGGDDGDLSVTRMVSRRSFSGYWEYRIEGALFTAPARTDHSGAGLFNAAGELVGIGSLVVSDAGGGDAPALRGNMFVPVDLLKPILSELRTHGAAPDSTRAWLGLDCVEFEGRLRVLRLTPSSPAEAAGLEPGDQVVAIDGVVVSDLDTFYKTLWRPAPPDRTVTLDVKRGDALIRLPINAIDRVTTLRRPQGI